MKIKNDHENAVVKNLSLNHGVFVPPSFQSGIPLHLAVNNIDGNQSFMLFKKKTRSTINC